MIGMNFFSKWIRWEFTGAILLAALLVPLTLQADEDPFGGPAAAPVQVRPSLPATTVAPTAEKTAEEKASEEKQPDEETAPVASPAAPVNLRIVRFHLMDGSMISGELTIDEIHVTTAFGELVVPIPALVSFKPGLGSYPEVAAGIDELIDNLGSDDYQTREQAHKRLSRMGLKVRLQLEAKKNDENAERKRHIEQLLKDLVALAEERAELVEEGEEEASPAWIVDDSVVTNKFTMVGKISPKDFVIESKYGPLNVKLSDIRKMDREPTGGETIVRNVDVEGTNLAQHSYKETGVRVNAGDRVSLTTDGQLVMSPWGSNMSSGPDGGQNFGWYIPNKIAGGTLIGRIGNGSEEFVIGSKHSFTAKRSGMLKLDIAMQAQYDRLGYNFPGKYNVKINLEKGE
jgi:hypothetical protein